MAMVEVRDVRKVYDGGFEALKGASLAIEEGEILALLGPNGAGKTTLISAICGITVPSSGQIRVGGHDVVRDYRAARSLIGLVPQEINLEPFETVANTVRFSRGLFGKRHDPALQERLLRQLSLWDKRDSAVKELSGGMKRRVLIAKALAHEPRVLFLDEPTAGVDVELRRDMWEIVADLRAQGVTIILTTHYIEEAEAIADRIGVINKGQVLLVEDKTSLMTRMGRKELRIELFEPVAEIPAALQGYDLRRAPDGQSLTYGYDAQDGRSGIGRLMAALSEAGLSVRDVATAQNSLEDIFVSLVADPAAGAGAVQAAPQDPPQTPPQEDRA
jgi:ABC-2 type transport system ATP-binding protein